MSQCEDVHDSDSNQGEQEDKEAGEGTVVPLGKVD